MKTELDLRSVLARWYVGGGLALVLLFTHPWLFGLYGYVLENRFQREIKPGMAEDQVLQMWAKTGDANPPVDVNNRTDFEFVDWESFCVESGKQIWVTFDAQSRVKSWSVQPWQLGC